MKLNIKKTLLAGTAIVAVGAFATGANAQTLVITADTDLDAAAVGALNDDATPVVTIDSAAVTVSSDYTHAQTANENLFGFITAGTSSLTINDGVTVTSNGTGDLITAADLAGLTVTVNGTLTASANTEDAINFGSLGAANGATINIVGGAGTDGNVTGVITGGDGADMLNITTTDGAATIDGVVDLGLGADVVTITSTAANQATFSGNLSADTITLTGGSTAAFGGDVVGNIGLNTSSIAEVAAGEDITGTVDNVSGSDNAGELILAGATTVSGVVGGTNSLSVVAIGNGTATFSETVNANTIDFDAAGTAAFAKSVTATTLSFDGFDGTVTLADDANFTGKIDNSFPTGGTSDTGTNVGTLTLSGTSTVSGTVGETNALKEINAAATGEAATFSSAVKATTINLTGTGDLNLNGATTATLLDFADNAGTVNLGATSEITTIDFGDAAGTLNIADDVNLTGDIRDTDDDEGTVNFAGSSAVTGNVGVAGDGVAAVNFNGGAGEAVSVSGTIVATDVKIAGAGAVTAAGAITGAVDYDAAGTLTLADGVDVTGAVGVSTQDQGTLNVAGDTTISSTLNAGGFELLTLNLTGTQKTLTVGGDTIAAKTNNIGTNTVAVTGTFVAEADDTLNFTIDSATTNGKVTSTGNATINADTIVSLDVDTTEFIADGTDYVVIDGTGGTGIATLNAGKIVDDSVLLSFTQQTPGGEDLTVRAARASVSSVTTNANAGALGDALVASGAVTALAPVQSYFQESTSADELEKRTEALSATVDGGFVVAGGQAGDLSFQTTNSRIEIARNGGADTGMVAGEMGELGIWGKAFGQLATQDAREGVSGYDADTFGVAVGVDSENIIPDALVGVSLSYASSEIESENLTSTDTDVNSYQLSLYGSKSLSQGMYVSGMLGYAMNDVEQTRHNVAGSGQTASSDFDGDQYMAYAEFGKDYEVNSMTLTPKVLANYAHMDFDGYTETGTSGGNLNVGSTDVDVFELGLGATAAWDLSDKAGNSIKPSLTAEYRYDVIGDEVETTSTFTGGGAAFKTEGFDPAQSSFLVGAGLAYDMSDAVTVSADYGYQFKEDYDAHNLSIRAGLNF